MIITRVAQAMYRYICDISSYMSISSLVWSSQHIFFSVKKREHRRDENIFSMKKRMEKKGVLEMAQNYCFLSLSFRLLHACSVLFSSVHCENMVFLRVKLSMKKKVSLGILIINRHAWRNIWRFSRACVFYGCPIPSSWAFSFTVRWTLWVLAYPDWQAALSKRIINNEDFFRMGKTYIHNLVLIFFLVEIKQLR